MLQNLNLQQKGLLLVSIPTAIVILFISVLILLTNASEQEAHKERQVRELLSEYNHFMDSLFSASFALAEIVEKLDSGQSVKSDTTRFHLAYQAIKRTRKRLAQLSRKDPWQWKIYQDLEQQFDSYENKLQRSLLASPFELLDQPDQGQAFLSAIKRVRELCLAAEAKNREAQQKIRGSLGLWVFVGLGLNLLCGLALLAVLNEDLRRRFIHAKENTDRVAMNLDLLPALEGRDEISDFDKSIHSMSNDLRKLTDNKHKFFAMITHDFRTPLTSFMVNVETIIVKAKLNESSDLKSHGKNLLAVADLLSERVNRLLEFEKLNSEKSTFEIVEVQFDDLLEESIELASASTNRLDLDIQVIWSGEGALVKIDRDKARAALSNLIRYAAHQSQARTFIRIIAKHNESNVEVLIPHPQAASPEAMKNFVHESGEACIEFSGLASSDLSMLIAKMQFGRMGGSTNWITNETGDLYMKISLPATKTSPRSSSDEVADEI